ncbi:MAG: DALR domain-containing protein, partial [Bacteroidota bacterium]
AKYWMHNNMITYEGQKMGKSLGNAISLREFYSGAHPLLDKAYDPMVIRFFILQAHYRSTLDFSNTALQAAEKGLRRMQESIKRMESLDPTQLSLAVIPEFQENLASFRTDADAAMNDDLNTARLIARMFDALPVVNQLFTDQKKGFGVEKETFESFRKDFLHIYHQWLGMTLMDGESGDVVDGLMEMIISLRNQARTEKNWPVSDLIRDKLSELQIKLEDGQEGTNWYYES